MKYTALTPLKHNGKRLEEGATLHLDEGAATDRLVELGAIAPVRPTRAPVVASKGAPSAATEPALAPVQEQESGIDQALAPKSDAE